MSKLKDERVGELAALGHMAMDGFWPVGAAYGLQVLNIPPVELLAISCLIASLFFLALASRKGQLHQLRSSKALKGCLLYTLCLLLPYAAIFYAAKSHSAIDVALFTQSEVIFAAVIGWLFLKEKLQAHRILG